MSCDLILPTFYKLEGSIRLPKTNIAPEQWWLEDYFAFGMAKFQGRAVKLSVSMLFNLFHFHVYSSLLSLGISRHGYQITSST